MPKVNIDLAQSYEDLGGPVEVKRDDVHYPTFHVESDKEIPFPHEGEMTIKFKKVSSSSSERDGETRYSCTIEVQKITELYPEKSEDDEPEPRTDQALDKLAKMVNEARKSSKSSY